MAVHENTEAGLSNYAFIQQLYGDYSKYIYKLAWKYCSNSDEVDDLVQMVWEKLCEKAGVLSSLSRPRQLVYIATALRNTAISLFRESNNAVPLEFADTYCYNESDLMLFMMDRKLRIERFKEVWPKVPAVTRELLERKYILMESDEEIATAVGIHANSVRTYLSRARKTACAILAEYKEEIL